MRPSPLYLPLVFCLTLGCDSSNEGGTAAEQLQSEQKDVQQAHAALEDARENVAEQKEELQDAKQDVAEQVREHEQAEDAVGDAQRQLEKEQKDLEAERVDDDPVVEPQN